MNYGFDEHDTAIAADDDHLPSGGRLVAGNFNKALAEPNPVLTYVSRVNPNLAIGGIALCLLGGAATMIVGIISASSAQRFEAERQAAVELAKAEAASTKAQTKLMDKYASISAQRPICISWNCGGFGRNTQPIEEQPIEEEQQPIEEEQQPIENVQPAAQTATPAVVQVVPTDAKTVEFWQYYQNDQGYIDQWFAFCQPNWSVSAECAAMYQALKVN